MRPEGIMMMAVNYRAVGGVMPELAAVGLWSTATDLARLLMEVGRAYRNEQSQLMSRSTALKADNEMLDLALHIIKKKAGPFDPKKFDDRYDAALLELVKAKMEGRKIEAPKAPEPTRPTDLMEALRQSADVTGAHAAKPKRSARKTAATKPKPQSGRRRPKRDSGRLRVGVRCRDLRRFVREASQRAN
jgi:hypothetical protein